MPTWVKVVLILIGLAILAAVVTGVIAFKFFKHQVELTERAGAEGPIGDTPDEELGLPFQQE